MTDGDPGPGGGGGADGDLPLEADRRLHSSAFSSGLTVPDFAACLQQGMRPVGLVQGFCVMQTSWTAMRYASGAYGPQGGNTLRSYSCPHGYGYGGQSDDHRRYGFNDDVPELTATWRQGYALSYQRMLEEAAELGAHGIIDVRDTTSNMIDSGVREHHMYGTAVVVEGAPAPTRPWSTYLGGQRLGKLIEAGYAPVSVAATNVAIRVWMVCVTEYLLRGRQDMAGSVQAGDEIVQIADAYAGARNQARDNMHAAMGNDDLHGARLTVSEHELGEGDLLVSAVLRGTQVHHYKDVEPLPAPVPTVRLS